MNERSFAGPKGALLSFLLVAVLAGCTSTTAPTADKPRPLASATVVVRTMPVANPDPAYDATCQTSGIVHLDASASSDPEGQPLTYTWSDVVDGAPTLDLAPRSNPYRTGEPEIGTGLYTIGLHELTLTVTAPDGRKSSTTLQVLVTSCVICGG